MVIDVSKVVVKIRQTVRVLVLLCFIVLLNIGTFAVSAVHHSVLYMLGIPVLCATVLALMKCLGILGLEMPNRFLSKQKFGLKVSVWLIIIASVWLVGSWFIWSLMQLFGP